MANKLSGDIQNHFNPVRIRTVGEGDLQAFLFDTGTVNNAVLEPQSMSLSSARSLNYLSNFTDERSCLLIMTTEEGEYFNVSNIYVYGKPSRNSFPQ